MTNYAQDLHNEISKILPIAGVSVGDVLDRKTWKITYIKTPTAIQQKDIDYIINNIVFITEAEDIVNVQSRFNLSLFDYKTLKKFEETLISMRDSRKILGKFIKPVITPASSFEERCLADDEYMALLDQRKIDRSAVKDNYVIPGKLPSKA